MKIMNAKEKSKKSFNKQAATYDTDKNGAHSRRLYNCILKRIYELPVNNMLDVGCGTGEMLKQLNDKKPQIKLTGIDISEMMLEKAKHKLNGKANFILCDAEKLPFANNSFDLVICNDSFHHYPAPMNVLKEFYRILNHDGILLISDYSIIFPIRQLMNIFIKFSNDGDVHIYSKKEIVNMLYKTSFKEINYKKIDLTGFIVTAKK